MSVVDIGKSQEIMIIMFTYGSVKKFESGIKTLKNLVCDGSDDSNGKSECDSNCTR